MPESTQRVRDGGRVPELAFLDLERAFALPHCPVCRVVRQAEERYIWAMLYERGLDPESRKAFDASSGFCRDHASLAGDVVRQRGFLSGACLATWYESAVATYLERLDGHRVPARKWENRPPCPVCKVIGPRVTAELKTLLRMLQQHGYRDDYASSEGLCVPHVASTAAQGAGRFLREDHRRRMQELRQRLRELQRKQAFDVLEEPDDRERISGEEALWRFNGVVWHHLLVEA